MIAINSFIAANLRILKSVGFLLCGEQLDILAQRALIAFERQNVISFFVHDFLGDTALTAHGVDGNDGALDDQHVEQLGNGYNLIRFFRHLRLSKDEPLA